MYRSIFFVLAVFGSVLVIALMLFGRDLQRAAVTGPGWKRALVAAGLALLGSLGMTSGCDIGPNANGEGAASSTELGSVAGQTSRRVEAVKPPHGCLA